MGRLRNVLTAYILSVAILYPLDSSAKILFEGYYRIENHGKHVGFSIIQESADPVKKTRTFKYYVNTRDRDNKLQIVESKSVYTEDFYPIEAEYKESGDSDKNRIQISFIQEKFQYRYQGEDIKSSKFGALFPDEFLRPVAHLVLIKNKPQKGKSYKYDVLREDLAVHRKGQIQVLDEKSMAGIKVFQILDDLDLYAEEAWLTEGGEIIRSRVPVHFITSNLVVAPEYAIGDLVVPREGIVKFFGEMPEGKRNLVSEFKIKLDDKFFGSKVDVKFRIIKSAIQLKLKSGKVKKKSVSK